MKLCKAATIVPYRAQTLFEDFWNWRIKESPEFATFCGYHQYDDRLDGISQDALCRKKVTSSVYVLWGSNIL